MRWVIGVALGACVGLGCAKTPYQLKQEYQEQQAERLRPAELEHDKEHWRAIRTLRVRIYLDAARAKKEGERQTIEESIERANQVLETALRARLVLEEYRDLPPELAAPPDVKSAIDALEKLDPGDDVDLVIAFIAARPIVTLSFHDIGIATMLGKHIVMRGMDDAAELRALEGFDTLDATERSRLYQQRKRHKESTVLLHEVGHTLGAIHTREGLELMHPSYDNDMRGFAPANVELMSFALQERLQPAEQRNTQALLQRMSEYVKASDWQGWIADERKRYLDELDKAIASGAERPAIEEPPAQPAPPVIVQPEEDLSALSEADRARYREIDQALQAQRANDGYEIAKTLAETYPASLPVQQKMCRMGMQTGMTRDTKRACDRMLKLSPRAPR